MRNKIAATNSKAALCFCLLSVFERKAVEPNKSLFVIHVASIAMLVDTEVLLATRAKHVCQLVTHSTLPTDTIKILLCIHQWPLVIVLLNKRDHCQANTGFTPTLMCNIFGGRVLRLPRPPFPWSDKLLCHMCVLFLQKSSDSTLFANRSLWRNKTDCPLLHVCGRDGSSCRSGRGASSAVDSYAASSR